MLFGLGQWWLESCFSIFFVWYNRDSPETALMYWLAENAIKIIARSVVAWLMTFVAPSEDRDLLIYLNGSSIDTQLDSK